MLLVKDKMVKLGNQIVPGQVRTIDITEAAIIEDIEDDKGNIRATQPTGYESAKVTIELVLDEYKNKSAEEQIVELQKLFRPSGQKKAELIKIVNRDCAARGISKVYFKSLSTQRAVEKTIRICTLELITPKESVVKVKKRSYNAGNTRLRAHNKKVRIRRKRIRRRKVRARRKSRIYKTTKKMNRTPAFVYSKNVRTYQNAIRTMIK